MSNPKFFSFRKPPDWRRGTSYQLEGMKDGLTIVREKVYRHLNRFELTHPQISGELIDTVVDPNGRWFMLDNAGMIWRKDLASTHVEDIIQLETSDELHPTLIAITGNSVVVILDGPSSVIQAMSLDRAQIRWSTKDWYGEIFHAEAIIADNDDGLLVIGTIGQEREVQLLRFDPAGLPTVRIPLPWFGDGTELADEEGAARQHHRYQLTLGSQQQCWLLDKKTQRIMILNLLTNVVTPFSLPLDPIAEELVSLCYSGLDTFWGLLRTREGFSLIAVLQSGEIVKRGFASGASGNALFPGKQCLYIWNSEQRSVYKIEPISETAIWKAFGSRMGVWLSDGLDSGVYEMEWHKLVLEANQQNDTQINIRYYASDQREVFMDQDHVDLDEYVSNEEIPPETKLASLSPLWSKPLKDPQDALLIQTKGRYLWLFIELIGSAPHAPVIQSLEIHFPRSSYLEYLPSIYQRDERSKDFLARYLSIFQTMIEDTDHKIGQVTRTLEANNASGSSLRWLLGWLGINAEDYWSEEQLRQLLKVAPTLYNLRGTKFAMETLISIYTGEKPIILEYEQVKPLKENPELGEVADRLYAADPHVFNVLVKAEHADTEMRRVTLQQLIEAYKPVFATCKLIILQPWVYMDLHSYLGMNTVLSEPTLLHLDGRSSMPHHTITIDVGQDNRIDQHTRLGLDSRLE
ncbi:phage tail protein [Paenibacillus luteus]|uniref:phage tail protein n=1 Tax=Paenibacillus luteus TaxID=2545753 RepID=UPI0011415765|nr:phage tail protein [Paenibacillus luteus]